MESENKRLKDELSRLRAIVKPTGNSSTLNNAKKFVNRNKTSTPKGVKGGSSSSFQMSRPMLPANNNSSSSSIVANNYAEALLASGSSHLRKCNVKMTANRTSFLVKENTITLVGELNAYIACGDIPLNFSTYYGNKAQDLVRTMMESKRLIDFDLLKTDPSYWYRTDTPENLKRFVENFKKAAELEEFQEKIKLMTTLRKELWENLLEADINNLSLVVKYRNKWQDLLVDYGFDIPGNAVLGEQDRKKFGLRW